MPNKLQRIAYVSQMAIDLDVPRELEQILASSQRNNSLHSITGGLVVSGRKFFQVLEGPPDGLARTMERIQRDARHVDLDIVSSQDVAGRLFPNWSMAAAGVAAGSAPEIERAIAACRDTPAIAIALVLGLVTENREPH